VRRFLLPLFLFLSLSAFSPFQVSTVTPAYQAPGWTGWTPASLGAALKVLWTADDHGTARMTDDGAGLISSWKTNDGSAATVTAATTARPTWSATAFGGTHAGLTCEGTVTTMVSTTLTNLPTGSTVGELIVSADIAATQATTGFPFRYGGGSAATDRGIQVSSANKAGLIASPTVLSDLVHGLVGPHIIRARYESTTVYGWTDGQSWPAPSQSGETTLATGTTRLRICASTGGSASAWFTGAVRLVAATTDLTTAQEQQLDAYFAWDANRPFLLPYNHPFRYRHP
jgi:hypothetical protein